MNFEHINIKDIKPLLPIPDISIYLFTTLIAIIVLIAIAAVLFGWKWWQKHHKRDPRIVWLKYLKAIDFTKPKKTAYTMTRYGRLLAEDKRTKEIYRALLPLLKQYKYKKNVPNELDSESKRYIKLFIQMVDDAL